MREGKNRLTRLIVATAALPLLVWDASGAAASPSSFHRPLKIDNRLFPLVPGTQFVYDGTVTDAEGTHRHRVIFTVTDLAKRVDGVDTRVIWDRDINDGELTEAELTFFAQDTRSNLHTMGEYPEDYEDGRFVGAPNAWITGQGDAREGILVPGNPTPGLRFVQGRDPAIDFYDVGVVKDLHAHACAHLGCFDDTTLIEESAPQTPDDGRQLKYYQPALGLVRVDAEGGDAREELTLTQVRHLGRAERAAAAAAALKLERRAYRVSAPYRHTQPMRCVRSRTAREPVRFDGVRTTQACSVVARGRAGRHLHRTARTGARSRPCRAGTRSHAGPAARVGWSDGHRLPVRAVGHAGGRGRRHGEPVHQHRRRHDRRGRAAAGGCGCRALAARA